MKILLLVDDYLPSTKSAPLMMWQLAMEMIKTGNEVTLLTPSDAVQKSYQIEFDGLLKIIRFRSGKLKNVNFLRRAINELLLSCRIRRIYGKLKDELYADLIVYYSPTIFFGAAVRMLKKRFFCPSFMILRDIFPQWAVDNRILRSWSPITLFFRFFERLNYNAADTIAVQSKGNLSYFEGTAFQKKVTVVYNWFDPDFVRPEGGGFREKYHLENKVIFFYGGNIGHAQDMDNLMRLARGLQDHPEAFFIFVGKGDEFELVQKRIVEYKLTNCLLMPPVEQSEYFKLLDQADVGLFSLHPSHRTHNFPGKLLGYMAYGKPILGSVNSSNDVCDIINNAHAGFVSVNPDDELFLQNARKLLNRDVRAQCGLKAKDLLLQSFNLQRICRKIIDSVDLGEQKRES